MKKLRYIILILITVASLLVLFASSRALSANATTTPTPTPTMVAIAGDVIHLRAVDINWKPLNLSRVVTPSVEWVGETGVLLLTANDISPEGLASFFSSPTTQVEVVEQCRQLKDPLVNVTDRIVQIMFDCSD